VRVDALSWSPRGNAAFATIHALAPASEHHRSEQIQLSVSSFFGRSKMALCCTCEGITLAALCDGLQIPGYASIEASAEQCPLCQILLHTLSEAKRPAWWKSARSSSERLTLQASRELPFALPLQNESPVRTKGGRRVIRLDIIHDHRVCGALSVFAAKGT
jgi:hypothetical protein